MVARVAVFNDGSISSAAGIIRNGGIIIFATDTVYGIGCDPRNAEAVEKVFLLKRREAKPVPLLCDKIETAMSIAKLGPYGVELAKRYWPGALTIVVPISAQLPFPIDQGSGMVGVRVPNSEPCRSLLSACGGILTGTSANLSGEPPCRSAEEAFRHFGKSVDLVLDGGYLHGLESTVARLTGKGIEILRQGSVIIP
jgi:L-threonylcarbamoyladenylate synthase